MNSQKSENTFYSKENAFYRCELAEVCPYEHKRTHSIAKRTHSIGVNSQKSLAYDVSAKSHELISFENVYEEADCI